MNITLDLQAELERGFLGRAQAKGVSLTDYAREVRTREAGMEISPEERTAPLARNLVN